MKKTVPLTLFAFLVAGAIGSKAEGPAIQLSQSVQIEKIAVGTGVQDRELVGQATEFSASLGRVYCWTKVTAQNVPTSVKHVWYLDGKKSAEVTLNVKYPRTRTWSNKAVGPGLWKVEVLDESGSVLSSVEFKVAQ